MSSLKIIDVSKFDGSIDWKKVTMNVDGVIIRAGYRGTKGGLVTDPKFKQYMNGAIDAKIPRIGVYWWTAHTSSAKAVEEAEYLLKLLKPFKDHVNFGVWLDSEASPQTSDFNKLSATNRTTYALAFLKAIKSNGYHTGIYASDSWFSEKLVLSRIGEYHFWVARYSVAPPKNVKNYDGWQYTEKGKCPGVSGDVDFSHFYTDFAGKSAPEVESKPENMSYEVEKIYTLKANMYVRKGAGTNYDVKNPAELTANGRLHCAAGSDVAILLNGTRVTCKGLTALDNGSVWMKIPSGWVCAIGSTGKVYVK